MLEERLSLGHIERRLAATAGSCRRQAEAARMRRKQRRLVIGLFVAAVIVLIVLAASAYAMPGPYARASLADVDGRLIGSAAVTVTREENATVAKTASDAVAASWSRGRAYAESTVADDRLTSITAVTLDDVSLFGGRITVARVDLLASANATRTALASGTQGSRIDGLAVDGKPVALEDLPLTIDGLGTLTALREDTHHAGHAVETHLSGLVVELSADWKDLPAGADVVVGELDVSADTIVARSLVPAAKPAVTPRPSSKPSASERGTAGGSSGTSGSSSAAGGGSASASGGASGTSAGGASSSYDPGSMPTPSPVDAKGLLDFAGAVFPVKGKYWYSDDFGVLMASGEHHTGIDIFALKRTPLVAVQNGTIEELRWRSLGGNSLHLVNDRGDYFYYAHLDHYAVGIGNGTRVTAGEVIGYVGNTGNARTTAPHCHFEVHPGGGGPVSPFPYLEEWRGAKPVKLVPAGAATSPEASPSGVATLSPEQRASRDPSFAFGSSVQRTRDARRSETDGGMTPLAASLGVGGGVITALVVRRRRPGLADFLPPLDTLPKARSSGSGS